MKPSARSCYGRRYASQRSLSIAGSLAQGFSNSCHAKQGNEKHYSPRPKEMIDNPTFHLKGEKNDGIYCDKFEPV